MGYNALCTSVNFPSIRILDPDEPISVAEVGSLHVWTGGETRAMAETERARTLAGYDERLDELRRYL